VSQLFNTFTVRYCYDNNDNNKYLYQKVCKFQNEEEVGILAQGSVLGPSRSGNLDARGVWASSLSIRGVSIMKVFVCCCWKNRNKV
jgi:hypothetical protein